MVTLRDGDVLKPLHVPIEIAIAEIPRSPKRKARPRGRAIVHEYRGR